MKIVLDIEAETLYDAFVVAKKAVEHAKASMQFKYNDILLEVHEFTEFHELNYNYNIAIGKYIYSD